MLNNDQFITIEKKIKETEVISFLKETYNIDYKSHMLINQDKNHNVFLIFLDFNHNESFQNLNDFKEKIYRFL